MLRDALRPLVEACEKVDQVLADAHRRHDICPSDFIDCDENCMWRPRDCRRKQPVYPGGVMTFIDAGDVRRSGPGHGENIRTAGGGRGRATWIIMGSADIAADSLRSRRPGVGWFKIPSRLGDRAAQSAHGERGVWFADFTYITTLFNAPHR